MIRGKWSYNSSSRKDEDGYEILGIGKEMESKVLFEH